MRSDLRLISHEYSCLLRIDKHWVVRGTGTPKDRDEGKRREV